MEVFCLVTCSGDAVVLMAELVLGPSAVTNAMLLGGHVSMTPGRGKSGCGHSSRDPPISVGVRHASLKTLAVGVSSLKKPQKY
jgi:hypothetical protein